MNYLEKSKYYIKSSQIYTIKSKEYCQKAIENIELFESTAKKRLSRVLDELISSDNFYSIAADLVERGLINNNRSEFHEVVDLIWKRFLKGE